MSVGAWDDMSSTEEKIPRDRWKRPLVVPSTGGKPVPYTRVTTFAGSIEDMYGLGQWQQRMVAIGLSSRKDLLLSVAAHVDDKDELNRVVDQAREAAAASAAATTGTALHKLAERFDRGQMTLDEMPESNRADMDAYAQAMAPFTIRGIEQFVVVDDLKIAGTFDRIVEYDGQRYVADIKTGSIEYGAGKMAVQLALYSRGWLYEPGKPDRGSTGVSQTAGIIIHLPAGQGRCDLYWIDLKAGWEAARLCDEVRAWRKRKGLLAAASFGAALLAEPEPAVGDTVVVAGIKFTKIGDDPFNAPGDGSAICRDCSDHEDGACPTDVQIAKLAATTLTEAFAATELTLTQQIAEAADAAALEALWAANRDEWTAEHTRAAAALKLKWHQQVLHRVSANAASNPA